MIPAFLQLLETTAELALQVVKLEARVAALETATAPKTYPAPARDLGPFESTRVDL